MAYPIPKEIAYEEKIAFGLTSKQLLYTIATAVLAFQCFNWLKTLLLFPYYAIPPYLIAMLGLGFVFMDFEERLKDLFVYHTNVKKGGYFDAKVRNFVEVENVDKDTLFLKNGGMRAILQVVPMNYSMFDEGRKKAVADSFASFLQQLSHPIQFHIKTVNVDLSRHFEKNEKEIQKKHPKLLPLYADFVQYEQKLISENAVRNRLFYIVVPLEKSEVKKGDRKKYLETLERRTKIVQEGLEGTGLSSIRLETSQLVSFISSYFEDRIAIGNEYLSMATMLKSYLNVETVKAVPLAADGNGKELPPSAYVTPFDDTGKELMKRFEKVMLKDLVCPSRIETTREYIRVNETYYKVVMGQGYPAEVEDGWLDRLISTRDNYDISLHIEPMSIESAKVLLHNQIIKEQADYTIATQKGNPNPSLANKLASTKILFDWLDKGEERLFNVSVYVMCKANNPEQLEYLADKCKADLNSVAIIPKIPYYRMAPAMLSVIPLGTDKLSRKREFPTSALAATFPFISSSLSIEEDGILLGHDRNNLNPIIRDLSQLSNMHMMILAKSGAGKSYTAKLLITRMLMKGTRVYIIDPSGEYVKLCKQYGGQVIKISRENDTIINPLDLCDEDYTDKRISLMGLFSILCGGLSPPLEGALDKALKETYYRKGITESRETWRSPPPIMSDLLQVLRDHLRDAQKSRSFDTKRTIQALITRVEKYCKGGVYSFVDRQTKIDANSPFVVFDIKDLPDEVKPMYMYIVLDFITDKANDDLERKAIVVDEGWSLLNQEKSAEHLLWLIKASRKFNTGMIFITQEVNDMLGSKAGESILANTATKILLAQDSTSIMALSEVLHLNLKERNLLTVAKKGDGLLILENITRVPISIKASPAEHDLITTNPDELKKMQEVKKSQELPTGFDKTKVIKIDPNGNVEIIHLAPKDDGEFDIRKGFFKKSDLTKAQVEQCLADGYEEILKSPGDSGPLQYLVKPRNNEGAEHAFFTHIIANEAWKYSEDVRMNETDGPDVIFTAPCGKIAVEIETSSCNRSEKGMREKFEKLAEKYHDFFILTTDKYAKKEYEEYGNTITRTEIKGAVAGYFNPKGVENE